MKYKKIAFASAFLLAALTAQVQAGFINWLGGTSDDWSDNSNWSGGNGVGTDDTAQIYHSLTSSEPTPYNTVLSAGNSATLSQIWLGRQGNWPGLDGNLTVESTATLTTTGDFKISQESSLTSIGDITVGGNFIMYQESTLISSGAISVGNGNGLLVRDNANVTLNNGATLNTINLNDNSTATLEAGSTVTTIKNINNSAQLTLNNIYTGNMFNNASSSLIVNGTVNGDVWAASDSSITVNGTLNGNFGNASTLMQTIGVNGTVNGNVMLDGSDQMTVAGTVNGRFSINQTAQAIIEPTANILSDSVDSWIFNTPSITWKVGVDGNIGTLRTNRGSGDYTADWRYVNAEDMVVDLTNCAVYATPLNLQLVSGIENESTFASNVTFLQDGENVTADFEWDGAGTGSFTGTLANPLPDDDNDGVANVDDAFPNDPNETADSDNDDVGDNADAFPNDPNETVDTDGDGVGDNGDVHPGYNDTELSTYLSNNSYIVDDGSSGGLNEQDLIDLRVGSKLASIANDQATLQVVIEQSDDLGSWSPLKTENVTVDAPAGTPKLFFRYRMQD